MEKEKLTMIELFSGIGAQKRGIDLTELFDCEVIATSDIDKEATVSYAAIHNGLTNELIDTYKDYPSEEDMKKELIDKNIGIDLKKGTNPIARLKGKRLKRYWLAMELSNNSGDISKIENLPYGDLWTYSFPCQDISVAGKQEGIVKDKTRSGLLYEVERLLEIAQETNTLPKYMLLENVKNLVGKQHKPQFDEWLNRLDELGFNTYWQVINGKNCGVPQNRERVFAISIRKDIDTGLFDFPKPFDIGYRLIDILEKEVDEKYYLSEEYTKRFAKSIKSDKFPFGNEYKVVGTTKAETERMGTNSRHWVYDTNDCMSTLDATMYKQPKQILETIVVGRTDKHQKGEIFSIDGLSRTLLSTDYKQPVQILEFPCMAASRGRNPNNPSDRTVGSPTEQRLEPNKNGTSNTITTVQKDNYVLEPNVLTPKRTEYGKAIRKDYESGLISESRHNMTEMQPREDGICNTLTTVQKDNYLATTDYRIRKLTPKECWRLMGFRDEDIDKCVDLKVSDSQLYKQAGNSIITTCIALLMERLYKAQYDNTYTCTDEKILNEIEEIKNEMSEDDTNFTQPQVD